MLQIRTFQPADAKAVRHLFTNGQLDFARDTHLEEEVRRYIQRSLSDDLVDIPLHYQSQSGSNFWVAEIDGEIKGMVGVQRRSQEEAELRRMSVASSNRRQGIGRRLLGTVEGFCRQHGYQQIHLTTVSQLQPAIAMYHSCGYQLVGKEKHGKMVVYHFVKDLSHPQAADC
jgi:GNAT superfamily N-acetyltransferase